MPTEFTSQQIDILKKLAITAGKAIIEVYENPEFEGKFETKDDQSPLTLADKISNEIIVKGLKNHFNDIPVISEEGKEIPYETRKDWNKFWLVDPLDGTKEFIKRNGEFTVNIALIENGIPSVGVIYVPVSKELYYMFNDESFKANSDSLYQNTNLKVANKSQNLIAIGSRTHSSIEDENYLSKFPISEYISAGSSLKFCKIAEGKADIYYRSGPTMEWDTAAGHAIVLGAGGKVENLTYNKSSLLNSYFICKGF